jgi:hypothetical protein
MRNIAKLHLTLTSYRSEVLINLDKYEECSQITSDSDELKTPSVEDKYLVGVLLHPQGTGLMMSP